MNYFIKNEEMRHNMAELAACLIETSTLLWNINLKSNEFTTESTALLFNACVNSPSLKLIRKINMMGSANFASEESCVAVVDTIAEAHALELLNVELY